MGCVCCSLSSFISILLDALERISLCTVCAMLTCCLLFTIITVMVLGIGIGFHYCFVQNSVASMAKAAKAAGAMRSGPEQGAGRSGGVLRSVDKAAKRGFAHRLHRDRRELELSTSSDIKNISSDENIFLSQNFTLSNITNFTSGYNISY